MMLLSSSRHRALSRRARDESQRRARRSSRRFAYESLESRILLALTVTVDYSLDDNGFFDTQAKKDLFQSAADAIALTFSDELTAIAPGGDNTWQAQFFDPASDAIETVTDMSLATRELIIFAGGFDLGDPVDDSMTLAHAAPGWWHTISGSSSEFFDAVMTRGQAGVLDEPATDFGPWGGSVSFTTNSNAAWHFGETTDGLDSGESDFYSIALHELAHVFGIGSAASWYTHVDTVTNSFSGPAALAAYDEAGNVPLDPPTPGVENSGLAHWLDGTTDEGVEAAMDPSITGGTRKVMTELDFAGLVDVGWELATTPDISIQQVTANGLSTLIVKYTISNGPVDPFDIWFYRSADSNHGGDLLLDTVTVSSASDLSSGLHELNFALGSGANEILFPGAGIADTSDDDFLLAVVDPLDLIAEEDSHPVAEDNTAIFEGVYHVASAGIYVWGSPNNDTVLVEPSSVKVTYNGASHTYSDSSVTSVRIRGKGGSDSVDGTTINEILWIHGGDGNDVLKGGNLSDSIIGGAGNDALQGRAGDELYVFDADASLGSDTVLETTGQDKLDFSSTSTQAVVLNLGLTTLQTVNGNLKLTLQAGGAIEHLTGGDQNDQLTGNAQANTLSGRGGNDTLSGSSNNDLYLFDTDIQLGSDTVIDQSGIDLLDFSSTTGQSISVNIGITTPQAVNPNLTLTLASATSMENVLGGALNDSITGNGLQNILRGNAGNDSLNGGSGNDTYQFDSDGALGSDHISDSAGTDTIDFTGTDSQVVTLNLDLTTSQSVNGNVTLTLASNSSIENVTGGSLGDLLRGNGLNNVLQGNGGNDLLEGYAGKDTLVGSTGNDSLVGGLGDDTYSFVADSALGTDTLEETTGGGIDTVSFSATTTAAVTLDLSQSSLQSANSFLSVSLSSSTHFENLIGGSKDDTLTGNLANNSISGGGGNDLITGLSGDDVLTGGAGNDVLIGGAGNDSYSFDADSSLGEDSIDESGGGLDLADFTLTTSVGVAVDLSLNSLQVVNSNLSLTINDATALENLTGGSGNDTLTGNTLNNVLRGNPGDDLINGGSGNDSLTGSAGNDSLIGGLGDDTYSFIADAALGTDTLDDTAGGTDTLSFSATAKTPVAVDMSLNTSQVVNQFLSLLLTSGTDFENAIGGSQADTLAGNSLDNSLTGNQANDVLIGGSGNDKLIGGVGNDSLQGGAGNDYYLFDADGQLGTDSLDESGGGSDFLDFTSTGSLSITVDLAVSTSQTVNSNLVLVLGAGATIEHVLGGTKNDTVYGNSLSNILVGGLGDDLIHGRSGADLLIGGKGLDLLRGDDDEDILVAGNTNHDANATALLAILAEWTGPNDYATRTTRLRSGAAGVTLAAKITAFTDTSVDNLDGLAATDWYFAAAADTVAVLEPGELKEAL